MSANSAPIPDGNDDDFDDELDDEFDVDGATAYDDFHEEWDDDEDDLEVDEEEDFASAASVEEETFTPQPVYKPKRARRIFRWMARLLIVAVIAGLAVGAYFLWPTVNERFIQRVENTAADLDTVEGRIDELDSSSADFATVAGDLDARLSAVESSQSATDARLDDIDELIAGQNTRIEDLDELAATLGTELELTNSAASRQLEVTRAAELMSRARLFLFQANYGLAAADLDAARTTLSDIDSAGPDAVDENLSEVIDRLDRAIANLPDLPVAAASDLDIAWQALLGTNTAPSQLPFTDAAGADAEPDVDGEDPVGADAGTADPDGRELGADQ